MDRDKLVRWGILALPASAFVNLITTPWRGHFRFPDDPGFAAWAASSGFAAWASAALNGTVWAIFGILALAAWADRMPVRLRTWGTFWSMTGLAVWLPITGIVAIAWPVAAQAALAGDAGAVDWVQDTATHRTFVVWSAFATAAWVGGTAALTWGLRRQVPVFAAAAFWLGAVLVSIPWVYPVELMGAALYLAGTAWIALMVWATRPRAKPRGSLP